MNPYLLEELIHAVNLQVNLPEEALHYAIGASMSREQLAIRTEEAGGSFLITMPRVKVPPGISQRQFFVSTGSSFVQFLNEGFQEEISQICAPGYKWQNGSRGMTASLISLLFDRLKLTPTPGIIAMVVAAVCRIRQQVKSKGDVGGKRKTSYFHTS
ncbi:MAG: hypothetical protein AAFR61_30645 [Bacteroidota bacterium]